MEMLKEQQAIASASVRKDIVVTTVKRLYHVQQVPMVNHVPMVYPKAQQVTVNAIVHQVTTVTIVQNRCLVDWAQGMSLATMVVP